MSNKESNSVPFAIVCCLLLAIGVLLGSIGTVLVMRVTTNLAILSTPASVQPPQLVPTIVQSTESVAANVKEYPGSVLIDIPKDMKPEDARLMRNILRKTLDAGEWEEVEWKIEPLQPYRAPRRDDAGTFVDVTIPGGYEVKLAYRIVTPAGKKLVSSSLSFRENEVAFQDLWPKIFMPINRSDFE